MNLPNQKRIIIHRESVKKKTGSTNPYLIAYQENLTYAMRALSGTAFKVYMMLVFNTDNYCISFSPKYVSDETGISLDSARNALKELEKKKFLVERKHLVYDFYERSLDLEEKERLPKDKKDDFSIQAIVKIQLEEM